MSLRAYKKKRSFSKTSEPQGGKSTTKELMFVIQKHDASHLHYDFRLEMDGVLKSWAVPKGPSTNPEDKRLAMMVEDHPYDYRNFEGIIPKGEYGGGTVMVWDEGVYEPLEQIRDIKLQEKHLLKQLKAGSLKIVLHGKKLKGEFALVKTNWKGENSWLLIKHNDKYASKDDILKKDKSVRSKKTIAQIEKTSEIIYGKEKEQSTQDIVKKVAKKLDHSKPVEKSISKRSILKKAVKSVFYEKVKPSLATLVEKPIDNDEWLYEIKWDGYRAIAFMNKKVKFLKSRNDKPFEEKFYPIFNAIKDWKINAIVDGEIVVVNEKGMANFGALQNWRSEADGELLYYVFDILWYNGYDLKALTLVERRAILAQLIPDNSLIRMSKDFDTSGTEFLAAAKKMGLEGIMAKRKDSVYEVDRRTANWLKIKSNKRQEVVIGGFTKNDDSPKPFSALLVGVYDKGKLIYTGKIGTGFTIQTQKELITLFEPLITNKHPFDEEPDINKPSRFRPNPPHAKAKWLKPTLICEVSFTEMTSDNVMRHPSFEGMREDKNAKEVVLEQEAEVKEVIKNKYIKPEKKGARKTLLNPTDETQVRKVNNHELKFTNLNKIYWPVDKITKRQLINYYYQVAPYILPYLKNRPQSLNRHPNGIDGQSFYQKDVTGKVPEWMDTYLYHTEDSDEEKHFLLGNNEATLLYMAGLGCIEINPWNSTIKKPDYPTWCIIDLDPDRNSFNQVIEAAQVTRQILDDMGVPSYCKTSGSTGLHIYIPLGAKYTYEQSKEFARIIVTLVNRELPKYTSLERTVKDRKGKMYLDFLQNRASATIAAPYSVRPKPGATVSMPLAWDEVKKGLKMKDFTIFNALERIESTGDLFKPVLGKGIDLRKVIR
ncbi:DNA ligase D [Pedobacter sp. Du54]|uniref:DNA ligase D n=1 Tax=Pedobacter anseongensis TaxID=3133439 RepID=UPI0030ADCBF3